MTATPAKIIVAAGESPWTGVAYTTKSGARRSYRGPEELLHAIGVLAGWPGPEAVTGPVEGLPEQYGDGNAGSARTGHDTADSPI